MRLFSHILCVLSLSITLGALHGKERVFTKEKAPGVYYFQVQDARAESKYSLQLKEVLTGETVATISEFIPSPVPNTFEVEWKSPDALNSVCVWQLLKDGELISDTEVSEKMPEKFHVGQASLKRRTGSVVWAQDRPAISRLFIANRSGMLISWAMPWTFASTGVHHTSWDFKDLEGVRDYRNDSDIHAFVQMVPLSKRWLVIGNVTFSQKYAELAELSEINLPKIPYDFGLTMPDAELVSGETGKPSAVYKAGTGSPVRVQLDAASKEKMGGRRYEILLFLNGEFIHEEAQGVDPYTFILPHFEGANGLHYLTVNLIDYHGNIAARTLKLDLQPES